MSADRMGCLMTLVSKLPCVPQKEPMKTVCLACTGMLVSGGAFAAVILALWRAIFGGHASPSPPSAPGSPGGGGGSVTQTGFFNVKTDISLALGGVAVILIVLMVVYGAGSWIKNRPARMMRTMALATRDQHIDQELGVLADRVAALGAAQAPVVQQAAQQVVRYEPQDQICEYIPPIKQSRVPLRYQGDFNDHMEAMQEGGYIRASRDGGALPVAGWVRRSAVRQVPIQGSLPQGGPRIGGGVNQEQFAGSQEYYEDGAQTAGAAINSTGMAA